MKSHTKTAVVALIMFVAGLSIGATRATNDYDRACQNAAAETEIFSSFITLQAASGSFPKAKARAAESAKRLEHWLQIMEEFKP